MEISEIEGKILLHHRGNITVEIRVDDSSQDMVSHKPALGRTSTRFTQLLFTYTLQYFLFYNHLPNHNTALCSLEEEKSSSRVPLSLHYFSHEYIIEIRIFFTYSCTHIRKYSIRKIK